MATASTRNRDGRQAEPEDDHYRQLQSRIQFPEDSAWARDMPVASGFTAALCDAVRLEDPERLRVRCNVTRDAASSLRFLCKVDITADATQPGAGGYAWSWWSPLVDKPEELLVELRRSLHLRQERLRAERDAQGESAPATAEGTAVKSRGPVHGTFGNELGDPARSDQPGGFCRNRRARGASYAAGSRSLRPRYPR